MKYIVSISFFFLLLSPAFSQDKQITTFVLVRHAEKASDGTDNPDLTTEGVQRAQKLLGLFKSTPITAIFSTRYKRTQNTVAPLAREKNLDVITYEKLDATALKDIVSKHQGGIVLVAGHSNTIPQIANALTGKNELQNFPDTEYGTILIVSVVEVGKIASIVTLKY